MDRGWWSGTVPPGWGIGRLKDHVTVTNGYPFDSSRFNDTSGMPLIRIRDLLAGSTETFFDGPVPSSVVVDDGDLLVGMDGDFNTSVWNAGRAALNQRLCRLTARSSLDRRFLRYLVDLPLRFISDLTYATTVKHLSASDLVDERFPLPPLLMQRAIADYLDAETARIDALIAKKQQMMERLLEKRRVVTISGVSGELLGEAQGPSSVPWLTTMAREWPSVKLNLVARLGSGHTPSRAHPEWWLDCAVPWITTGEVAALRSDRVEYIDATRECISELGLANSAAELHPAATVVLCRTASAGYSGIMRTPMATSQDFVTWTCGPTLRPRFLLLCLRAMRQDLLGRLAMGSTHKTIYMPDIESIRLPLPSVHAQDRLVDEIWSRLAVIDSSCDKLLRQVDLLRERRQGLITAAVTGELDIPGVAA